LLRLETTTGGTNMELNSATSHYAMDINIAETDKHVLQALWYFCVSEKYIYLINYTYLCLIY